jgi:ribonucleotide reductase alpha subunit
MDSETKNKRRGGGRAYRSRLELFAEFIREQRQQRRTWQEIAARLRTEKDCVITFQGLHQFYRRYLKRQARSNWESEAVTAQPATVNPSAPTPQTTTTTETDNPYRFNNLEI